ncbi:cytochrome c oxidase subunit 1 [Serendipita sp. 407]|nr:cytochrome c oxidase subunit 1 [Serendipita sp. 407]
MVMKILRTLCMPNLMVKPPNGEAAVLPTVRRDAEANLAPPVAEMISPLSSDPQPVEGDLIEFEVKGPSEDGDAEEYDKNDDLAVPLKPLSREFIHQNFPVPSDILEIDTSTFDTQAVIKKYGYKFDDTPNVPKRRALLIGLKGTTLKGSYGDVDDMKALLKDIYGFQDEEVMVLKDENPGSILYPTRQVVVDHLFILAHSPREGDRLFILFAGHGAQIEDLDGDEADGLDEVICCADGKIIVDDQLHDIIVKPLPKGCRLTAVFDCCSSETGLDLVQARPSASPHLSALDLQFNATFASGALDLPHSFTSESNGVPKHSDGEVVLWSACLDNADSHEILIDGGKYKGAMSHAFVQSIRQSTRQSYGELLESIKQSFKRWHVPQVPQLTSSHKLDQNDLFTV